MVAQNPRLSVTHNGHNTWKLHVSNVQKNDSGTYMCQINTDRSSKANRKGISALIRRHKYKATSRRRIG